MRTLWLVLATLMLLAVAVPAQAQDCFEAERSNEPTQVGYDPTVPRFYVQGVAGHTYYVYLLNCDP